MESLIEALTMLDEREFVEQWIICFAAFPKLRKLKYEKANGGENEIIDLYLATKCCEVVKKYRL